ncbi:hypothetical protein GCM10011396_11110 [Undibacterium terreum]|uniref:Uncharacterized protein n=1 Tax=Undibacterium terreum TaxID=1224302 RepID=A0A916UBN5_9BURK|nr:hypothetical protein GCM10011396_11110 [Undibacterium terreum]
MEIGAIRYAIAPYDPYAAYGIAEMASRCSPIMRHQAGLRYLRLEILTELPSGSFALANW